MPLEDITSLESSGNIGTGMLPKRYDIKLYQGDNLTFGVNFYDSLDQPLDLSTATFFVTVKVSILDSEIAGPYVDDTNASTGSVRVVFPSSATDTMASEIGYYWEFGYVTGGETHTKLGGVMTIIEDITASGEES